MTPQYHALTESSWIKPSQIRDWYFATIPIRTDQDSVLHCEIKRRLNSDRDWEFYWSIAYTDIKWHRDFDDGTAETLEKARLAISDSIKKAYTENRWKKAYGANLLVHTGDSKFEGEDSVLSDYQPMFKVGDRVYIPESGDEYALGFGTVTKEPWLQENGWWTNVTLDEPAERYEGDGKREKYTIKLTNIVSEKVYKSQFSNSYTDSEDVSDE